VKEVVSKSKEEMDKAIEKMRQDNELRIKTLEEQHSKKEAQLKSQYEEKMILFSSSSSLRAPACTVSESQLRQSLNEAKEEIQALKQQAKQMVCAPGAQISLSVPRLCVLD
jgi:chaperonin cofactor prefoldin